MSGNYTEEEESSKIVLAGSSGVGKQSIINRAFERTFSKDMKPIVGFCKIVFQIKIKELKWKKSGQILALLSNCSMNQFNIKMIKALNTIWQIFILNSIDLLIDSFIKMSIVSRTIQTIIFVYFIYFILI